MKWYLRYKSEVKKAFAEELHSQYIKIDYADPKEARFKNFIDQLAKDSKF